MKKIHFVLMTAIALNLIITPVVSSPVPELLGDGKVRQKVFIQPPDEMSKMSQMKVLW